jgi:hypothetical protein
MKFFQIDSSGFGSHWPFAPCKMVYTYPRPYSQRQVRDGVCECGRTVRELEYAESYKARSKRGF